MVRPIFCPQFDVPDFVIPCFADPQHREIVVGVPQKCAGDGWEASPETFGMSRPDECAILGEAPE